MSERHVVCARGELRPGESRVLSTGSRELLVVRTWDESFAAVANACPHQGARLSDGRVERIWTAGDDRHHEMLERFAVVCPWHNFEFDLDTGRSPYEPDRLRIATYRAELEEDKVVVYA